MFPALSIFVYIWFEMYLKQFLPLYSIRCDLDCHFSVAS